MQLKTKPKISSLDTNTHIEIMENITESQDSEELKELKIDLLLSHIMQMRRIKRKNIIQNKANLFERTNGI